MNRNFLLAALPGLLPSAVEWAKREEARALASGDPLSPEELEIASRAGVRAREKIRVVVAEELPAPESPVLRAAAAEAGLLGPAMIGLTLGYAIFLRRGHEAGEALSHEFRHVYQYESRGGIAGLFPEYLAQVIEHGYADAPFEIDARNHETGSAFPHRRV